MLSFLPPLQAPPELMAKAPGQKKSFLSAIEILTILKREEYRQNMLQTDWPSGQ